MVIVIRKTRGAHNCLFCDKEIDAGKFTIVFEGYKDSAYSHSRHFNFGSVNCSGCKKRLTCLVDYPECELKKIKQDLKQRRTSNV